MSHNPASLRSRTILGDPLIPRRDDGGLLLCHTCQRQAWFAGCFTAFLADKLAQLSTGTLHRMIWRQEWRHNFQGLPASNGKGGLPAVSVRCIFPDGTRKVYPSIRSTRHDGFNPSSVSQCLAGTKKMHRGVKWERLAT